MRRRRGTHSNQHNRRHCLSLRHRRFRLPPRHRHQRRHRGHLHHCQGDGGKMNLHHCRHPRPPEAGPPLKGEAQICWRSRSFDHCCHRHRCCHCDGGDDRDEAIEGYRDKAVAGEAEEGAVAAAFCCSTRCKTRRPANRFCKQRYVMRS